MRLRARTPKGVLTVGAALDPRRSTFAELRAELAAATESSADRIAIRAGFPPRPLAPQSDASTLAECGIADGDQIIVEIASPSKPAPPAAPAPGVAPSSSTDTSLPEGTLVVREMKDDNSCLFRSIGYLFERNPEATTKLRRVVADAILSDPIAYNEAILGRNPKAYSDWIQQPNSWGGAIELAIFSAHYKTEIDSIDIQTGRMDRFGEGSYENRVFVLYSGIHYDAIALSPADGVPADFDQTMFCGDVADRAAVAASKLAGIWRKQHKFTDLANFTLRCNVCSKGLKGQKEAQAHAMDTGHTAFGEYDYTT